MTLAANYPATTPYGKTGFQDFADKIRGFTSTAIVSASTTVDIDASTAAKLDTIGVTGDFVLHLSNVEQIYIASRAGQTCTFASGGRAFGSPVTTQQDHPTGALFELVAGAGQMRRVTTELKALIDVIGGTAPLIRNSGFLENYVAGTNRFILRNTNEAVSQVSILTMMTGAAGSAVAGTNLVGTMVGIITQADPSVLKSDIYWEVNGGDTFTEKMRLTSAGQLQLPTTGSTGGLLLGGDALAYRPAAGCVQWENTSANTGRVQLSAYNLSGGLIWGTESSAGGAVFSGAGAYESVIGTGVAKKFHLGYNQIVKFTVDSAAIKSLVDFAVGSAFTPGAFTGTGGGIEAGGRMSSVSTSAGNIGFRTAITGEANEKFRIFMDGSMEWGAGGGSAPDVKLYRIAANALATDDDLGLRGGRGLLLYKSDNGAYVTIQNVADVLHVNYPARLGSSASAQNLYLGNVHGTAVDKMAGLGSTSENSTSSSLDFYASGVKVAGFDVSGNMYVPPGTTGMIAGFINIPAAAGAPSGSYTPPSGTVALYYDTTNDFLYVRTGGAWKKSTVYA